MKEMIAVVGVALCMACSGVDINLSGVLPLDEAIDRAERGDAHGLYSLAINCAKGAEAAEWGTSHWLRESVWKLLNQAAAAGSADAWLLMGALAERELYDKYIFVWMYSSGGRQGGGAVSSLPALETDVLTDDILRSITPELPGTDSTSKSVTMARRRLGNAGRRLEMVRNQADQKRFLVYHSDSQESVWYNPNGLTNEVVKTYIRSQYLKAKELGSSSAAAALSHFETNCLRMAAIMDAIATEIRQREVERAEQRAQFRVTREEQMRIREAREVATKREYVEGCAINKSACVVNKPAGAAQKPVSEKSSVAEKLGQCDFLINKDFKKNAKFYLCLFSASWCGPCRAEMPRIAKTYAETLKDDPDIELIHFSRDQNDEKAMAWAKEHNVKFPVVKPNGGNPLNLHTRGIPHLFIVKADGTLVEEGHPMRIFNEEKFRELKGGGATDGVKPQDGRTCSSATEGVTKEEIRRLLTSAQPRQKIVVPHRDSQAELPVFTNPAEAQRKAKELGLWMFVYNMPCTRSDTFSGSSYFLKSLSKHCVFVHVKGFGSESAECPWERSTCWPCCRILDADGNLISSVAKWSGMPNCEVSGQKMAEIFKGFMAAFEVMPSAFDAVERDPDETGLAKLHDALSSLPESFVNIVYLRWAELLVKVDRSSERGWRSCYSYADKVRPLQEEFNRQSDCRFDNDYWRAKGDKEKYHDFLAKVDRIALDRRIFGLLKTQKRFAEIDVSSLSDDAQYRLTYFRQEVDKALKRLTGIQGDISTSEKLGKQEGVGPVVAETPDVEDANAKVASEKAAVAQKLQSCDFLLNKDFKKNAKVYLCLFSASWCPPCRAEMTRIAKTYAETLKDDPDIELIHFSRDQNDEKAMAWAKEHDVKFPVVKPRGGNPLELHCNGIPHLFIVKADGTLVEEGHPMRIFNEEKFRELKWGGATDGVKPQDGRTCSSATDGVTNVTTEGGLFTLTGPYGIRMTADPGCEKGAEYVMKKLVEVYLPRAKEFYGDPFLGEKPSRTYRIDVDQNDGLGNSTYTGPSYSPRTGSWSIGLSKGADRYEMSLDYLASSVLTLCEEPKWASFVFYVNRFVEAKAKGIDAAPRLKEDIRRGLEEDDEDGKDNWYRSHAPLWAALEDLRTKHPKLILDYCALKNKRFSEGKLPKKLSLDQMAALLSEVSGENASELFNKYGVKDSSAKKAGSGGNSPARAKSRDGKDYSKGEMGTAVVDGITWSYSIQDGEATIVPARGHICAISPRPQGDVTIPSKLGGVNVTGIGKSAFAGCKSMATVVIPPSVRSIGDYVFYDCMGLTSVTIPTSVTNIGFGAFFRCNGLTSVTIPDGVKSLKDSTFCYCNGLTSVKIPPTLTNMGRGVFSGCRGLADSQGFVIVNGILCSYEGYMPSVSIPAGVTCIGDAFSESKSLKSVTIPSSVKNIRNRAFCGSFWLASVTMLGERPESPNDVFRACRNLKAIHVPPNAKSWAGMKEWQGIPLVFDAETK